VTPPVGEFSQLYAGALRAYLSAPGEDALHTSYDLGRWAITKQLGALDIVWVHREALSALLESARSGEEATVAAKLSSTFLLESLAAFEMTHRGFLEALVKLSQDSIELARANQQLEAEIRERREAEESLKKSESRLAEAQGVARIGSWEWDIADDQLTWTDELYRLFRLDRDAAPLTYERYLACLHPDDRAIVDGTVRRAMETRAPFELDHRLLPGSGEERWIHSIGRVDLDARGNPVRMVGTAQDITAQKEIEDALRRSEELFRSLVENSLDVITILNPDGTVRYKSPSVERVLGYPERELIGRNIFERVHPDDAAGLLETFRVFLGTPGYSSAMVFRYRHADGSWKTLESLAKNLVEVPGIAGVLVTSRDITEKMRLEQQLHEAALERESDAREFAARVQRVQEEERQRIARELHDDICQRLTALRLHVNIIEDTPAGLGISRRKRLRSVKQQLDLMITDVRRMSANLRPTALDLFGLETALRTLCEEVQRTHGLPVSFKSDGGNGMREHPVAEIALYRIAQEGLSNAARHSSATRATLTLSHDGGRVSLTIRDDGKGFDPGAAARRGSSLTGYGLSSMRERTELLGGSFRVVSAPSEGTTIFADLPLEQP